MPKANGSRKGRSERKKRDEEDVDNQLKGLYEENTPFKERKQVLAAINESRKAAPQSAGGAETMTLDDEESSGTPSPIEQVIPSTEGSVVPSKGPEQGRSIETANNDSQSPKRMETYASKLQSGQNQKDSFGVKELHVVLEKIDLPIERKGNEASAAREEDVGDEFETVVHKKAQAKNAKSASEKNGKVSPTSHTVAEATAPENIPKKAPELSKEDLKNMRARARELAELLERVQLPHSPLPYPLKVDEASAGKDVLQTLIDNEQNLREAQLLMKEQTKWKDPVNLTTFTKKMGFQAAETSPITSKPDSPPMCNIYDFPQLGSKEQEIRADLPSTSLRSKKTLDRVADEDDFQLMETDNRLEPPPVDSQEGQCPICRRIFPVNALEEHAARCNDFLGEGEAAGTRPSRPTRSNRMASARFPNLNQTTREGTESDGPKAKERGAIFTSIIEADDGDYRLEDDIEQCDTSDDPDFLCDRLSSKRGKKQPDGGAGAKGKKRRC